LDSTLKNKVKRFHHISTDEVFGALPLNSSERFNESSPYQPKSPYAASKAAADHLVRAYYHTYGLPITISNCSNNFGPYQFPEKIIPLFVTNLLEGEKVPLYGDGLYIRDWIYIEDHCLGIDLILQKGKSGETYLIGADSQISNMELAKKILKLLDKDESFIEHVKDRPGHDRRYAIDASKIENQLGFKPKYNFDEVLKSTVEWYVDNKEWWQKIKTGEYLKYYEEQYGKR
jgi:dTDP-glucose 4,6-dehydratase